MQYLLHGYGFINTSEILSSKLLNRPGYLVVRQVKMIINYMYVGLLWAHGN